MNCEQCNESHFRDGRYYPCRVSIKKNIELSCSIDQVRDMKIHYQMSKVAKRLWKDGVRRISDLKVQILELDNKHLIALSSVFSAMVLQERIYDAQVENIHKKLYEDGVRASAQALVDKGIRDLSKIKVERPDSPKFQDVKREFEKLLKG